MATAKVLIKGEDRLKQPLNQSKQELNSFASYAQQIGKKIESAFTVTAIIAALRNVANGIKECVEEYAECEKVSLRLQKVWENVGQTTGKTYKEIDKYAESLEKSTYFTAEAAKESALLLAATESLTDEGFERALDASADLAAALGEDMTAAASTLAKALSDPEAALSRLKTIGVTFTEEEKAQIKALSDANQQYEAQSIILEKIESKYKDVAKAINNTPAGKLDNIRDVLSDIRKNLGSALLDSISPALDELYSKLLQISNWIAENTDSKANEIKTKIVSAAKKGNVLSADLSEYSTNDLLKAYDSAKYNFENPVKVFGQDTWALSHYAFINVQRAVQEELTKRGYEGGVSGARTGNYGPTSNNSIETTITETVSPVLELLSKYGNASESYIRESYQKVIDQSQAILQTIEEYSGNFYDSNGVPRLFYNGIKDALGLPEGTSGDDISNMYIQLNEVIAAYTEKLAKLDEKPEEKKENLFEKALSQYGSLSKAFQIDEIKSEINKLSYLRVEADDVTGHYLDEIVASLFDQLEALEGIEEEIPEETKTFMESLTGSFGEYISKTFNLTDEQGGAAAGALIGTAVSNMGEAGEVVGRLAQNMATMTPVIGAIVTALQYVLEGLMEGLGEVLNTFVKFGVGPLREFGRILAEALIPLFEAIMPSVEDSANMLIEIFSLIGRVLKPIITTIGNVLGPILSKITQFLERVVLPIIQMVANVFIGIATVIEWVGQWIGHLIASVINWAGGWLGIHVNDPGRPEALDVMLSDRLATVGEYNNSGLTGSDADTASAVQNASYTGGTTVYLNVFNYGNVIGENGFEEFALIIRDKLYETNYFGK